VIGYGHITPKTSAGMVVTMFYAIVGIPLTLLTITNLGRMLATAFRFLYRNIFSIICCCCSRPRQPETLLLDVPGLSSDHNHGIIIMVARSSIARARLPLCFTDGFIFLSLATLTQTSENRHPRNFSTRLGLVFNRTFAIAISSRCPLKRTGAEKPKICTIFHAKSQTISAVVRQCEDVSKI